MKVADFLAANEITGSALAKQLGYTGAEAVNSRRRNDDDVPDTWVPKLRELGYDVSWAGPLDDTDDAEDLFRQQAPPAAPDDATLVHPVKIDYASVAGYIEGSYKLAAQFAVPDPVLAAVINEHAAAAGNAWAKWIESEPKVAALVQRLMIGTPLGEVIGVHVGIVFSYTLARTAARQVAAEAAARAATEEHGPTEPSAEDLMAAA